MSRANPRALVITAALAAAYFGCQSIAVPYAPSYNLMTLGLKPAFGMFLLVEVLSCILPPLTGFRRQGFAGRAKLNVVAIVLTVLFASTQGYFGARTLLMYPDTVLPGDGLYSDAAEMQFTLIVIASLAGGAVLAMGLAYGITRLGITNGVSRLILGDVLRLLVEEAFGQSHMNAEELQPREFDLTRVLMLVAGMAAAVWLLRRARTVAAQTLEGSALEILISPIPQSLSSLSLTDLASLMITFSLGHPWTLSRWLDIFGLLFAGVPLLSWILYYAFSSPGRVVRAIGNRVRLSDSSNPSVVRQAFAAGAVLIGVPLTLAVVASVSTMRYVSSWPSAWITTAASLIAVGALFLDIFDFWMFRQRVPQSVRLFDLDNVHVASCAYALLRQRGIDCCLEGYQYRRLLFHFGAAIKMSLYVPTADADAARALLRIEEFGTV